MSSTILHSFIFEMRIVWMIVLVVVLRIVVYWDLRWMRLNLFFLSLYSQQWLDRNRIAVLCAREGERY